MAVVAEGDAHTMSLLMDFDSVTGEYRVWEVASREQVDAGAVVMGEVPLGQGVALGLVSGHVSRVAGVVVARQPLTSTTSFYELINGRLVEIGHPVSDGIQVTTVLVF